MKFTLGFVPSIRFLTRNGVIPRRVSTKVSPGGQSKVFVNPLNWRQCSSRASFREGKLETRFSV